ncbi:MAG TPA: hypothetical protein VMZ53_04510 [Kofleriaceae bacterium]|nr:hypothetical protein [Kofleriaceae bacterium]
MHRLLFLSTISVAALVGCEGCGDDSCGPGDAPATGLIVGDQDQKLTFGNLSSSANNDCPDPSAPAGVVSLTVSGSQTDAPTGGSGLLTLCIPRPDQLAGTVQLGTGVKIIDLHGQANGCMYSIEATRPITGTAYGSGVCNNGQDGAGYALTFDGHISLKRECPTATDTIAVNVSGEVAVAGH